MYSTTFFFKLLNDLGNLFIIQIVMFICIGLLQIAKYHRLDILWDEEVRIDELRDTFCSIFNPTMYQILDILLFAINLMYMSLSGTNQHVQLLMYGICMIEQDVFVDKND